MGVLEESKRNFLVYAYSDENLIYYYIGKGRPGRPYQSHKNVKKPSDKKHIHVLVCNLTEDVAFELEKFFIQLYGRKDIYPGKGILENKTNGGQGFSGCCLSGSNHPFYGKSRSRETKNKISIANRGEKNGMFYRRGDLNPMFGKTHTDEVKEKLRSYGKARIGIKNKNYTPRDWSHPEFGIVTGFSITDMVKNFPDQKLSLGNLSSVANGKRKHHKGWKIIRQNT